jgi:hypothetical protein
MALSYYKFLLWAQKNRIQVAFSKHVKLYHLETKVCQVKIVRLHRGGAEEITSKHFASYPLSLSADKEEGNHKPAARHYWPSVAPEGGLHDTLHFPVLSRIGKKGPESTPNTINKQTQTSFHNIGTHKTKQTSRQKQNQKNTASLTNHTFSGGRLSSNKTPFEEMHYYSGVELNELSLLINLDLPDSSSHLISSNWDYT